MRLMNASPYNTLGDLERMPSPVAAPAKNEPPQRDALQALLAFAALQQQIRSQKKQANSDSGVHQKGQSPEERFALDEVLQLVAERALAITHADGVAIALAEDGAIVCRAVAGSIAPDKGAKVNPNYGFSGACLSSGGMCVATTLRSTRASILTSAANSARAPWWRCHSGPSRPLSA